MFMAIVSRLVSAWFAFLIPCYHTWKALSRKEPDLELWAMYWTCVGAFVAFENAAGWFVSWLPFYWELRTIFLLFMALPQTQGSTWFYNTYLQPFFSANEAAIDAGILNAQNITVTFLQTKFGSLWDALWRFATTHGAAPPAPQTQQPSATNGTAPSRTNLYALGTNIFHTYGPWAMGAISRTMGSTQPPAPHTPDASPSVTPHSQSTPTTTPGVQQRKSYTSGEEAPPPFPTPQHY